MYHSTRPPNNSMLRPLKSIIVLDTLLLLFSLSGATAACLLWFYLVLAWKLTGPQVRPVFRSLPSLFMNHNRMHDCISSNLRTMGSAATYQTCTVALPFQARRQVCHVPTERTSSTSSGPAWQAAFNDLLSQGIFNSDSNSWLVQRKTAALEFTTRTLRQAIAQWVR